MSFMFLNCYCKDMFHVSEVFLFVWQFWHEKLLELQKLLDAFRQRIVCQTEATRSMDLYSGNSLVSSEELIMAKKQDYISPY